MNLLVNLEYFLFQIWRFRQTGQPGSKLTLVLEERKICRNDGNGIWTIKTDKKVCPDCLEK